MDNCDASRFIEALFTPNDHIVIRPIETWSECGRKHSRVDYDGVRYLGPSIIKQVLPEIAARSETERTNTFFGVCPRVGGNARYDQAWQIRTVRALWVDIDHTTFDEAVERCAHARLPVPSIVVSSGNGAHLYWLLDAPFEIDDVDKPLPVLKEWTECNGKKRPREYVLDGEVKIYLANRPDITTLSPKANHVQDVLAGIAHVVGGDHTHDLCRQLRVPGTANRKDERNGKEPTQCVLVSCDATIRYAIDVFEQFKIESPVTQHARKIEAV